MNQLNQLTPTGLVEICFVDPDMMDAVVACIWEKFDYSSTMNLFEFRELLYSNADILRVFINVCWKHIIEHGTCAEPDSD
tara:strand:- start:751 stop:990 length:240 start_codon:yes stop_codon:yes gene_type:complete